MIIPISLKFKSNTRQRITDIFISDNRTQFSSNTFRQFALEYGLASHQQQCTPSSSMEWVKTVQSIKIYYFKKAIDHKQDFKCKKIK